MLGSSFSSNRECSFRCHDISRRSPCSRLSWTIHGGEFGVLDYRSAIPLPLPRRTSRIFHRPRRSRSTTAHALNAPASVLWRIGSKKLVVICAEIIGSAQFRAGPGIRAVEVAKVVIGWVVALVEFEICGRGIIEPVVDVEVVGDGGWDAVVVDTWYGAARG